MRRILIIAAVLVALLVAPAAASASVSASAKGWGYQVSGTTVWCELDCYRTAYSWNGSAWSKTQIHNGTQVYLYPYGGGWHWVWTQKTNWLAVRDSDLTNLNLPSGCRWINGSYACIG